jgi:hypothetical protein
LTFLEGVAMGPPLKILFVEDVPADLDLSVLDSVARASIA